jgi:hypothetical protein
VQFYVASLKSAQSSRSTSPSKSRPGTQEGDQSLDFSASGGDIADIVLEGTRSLDYNDGLDLLHTHRLSHVAETGVLGSRPRRATDESEVGVPTSAQSHRTATSGDVNSPATSTESINHFPQSTFDTYPTITRIQQRHTCPDYYEILSAAAAYPLTPPNQTTAMKGGESSVDATNSSSPPVVFSDTVESTTSDTPGSWGSSSSNPNRHGKSIKPETVQIAFAEFEDDEAVDLSSETIYPETVYSLRRELERRIAQEAAEPASSLPQGSQEHQRLRSNTQVCKPHLSKDTTDDHTTRPASGDQSQRSSTEFPRRKLQKRNRRIGRSDRKDGKPEPETPKSFRALRDSTVVRKVNSSFQILRPGSLGHGIGALPKEDTLNLMQTPGGSQCSGELQTMQRSTGP